MVVAVFIGVGIGYLLKIYSLSLAFLAWSFWGISAAILNVYKAYKVQVKSYEEFKERDELIKEKFKKKRTNNGT